ncbi:AraC family transcriptional regulator [Pseudorhodoplanes sp.]|uniref:AraC family transcriptional regulator n=1 Tax=Pseudorhodoplanes sp. TaxID=1934341 RepID=UPI002BB8EFC8|nr:AraC family transcriptional regulator [Pseudorhodoplanes sp.]HWV52085.1 AraC family transcriptional regulator [Pseudorhodoplanes sp.]
MSSDTLSDVLRAVRLTGAVFIDVNVTAPWATFAPQSRHLIPLIMPDAQHLVSYHLITEGECYAVQKGHDPVKLQAGDMIVFPHGDHHTLATDPSLRAPASFDMADVDLSTQRPWKISGGGGSDSRVKLVCGFLGCDVRPFNPLLAALPVQIHCRGDNTDSDARLSHFYRMAVAESYGQRIGGESILAKLSELLFIELVRMYLESLPTEQTGWLAGLRDRHVGHALSLMHAQPARDWTLETLSSEVGLSRSALADRFTDFVGMPPMQYLAKWRMQIASGLLTQGRSNIAKIAVDVGYESEAAFSRAFKKVVGMPPAAWRKSRQTSAEAGA